MAKYLPHGNIWLKLVFAFIQALGSDQSAPDAPLDPTMMLVYHIILDDTKLLKVKYIKCIATWFAIRAPLI